MRKWTIVFGFLLGCGAACAQEEPKPYQGSGLFGYFKRNYLPGPVSPVNWGNSNRLDQLMRAGRIYLSLQDAIAAALENNLDIEVARLGPSIAQSDQLRASAGSLLRGISTGVSQGPSSASSGVLAGANQLGNVGNISGASGQGGVLSGISVQLAGSAIPNLDPYVFVYGQQYHQTSPMSSSFVTGTNFLVSQSSATSMGIQKGFLTGTTVTLQNSNNWLTQNSPNNDFNPNVNGNMTLTVTQHILQGWGLAVNNRAIRVARNNLRVSDLVFQQQVIATVNNVVGLYYDLVTLNANLKVQQQSLELSQKLYGDNKRRAELGAIAPIDIVQAEAEVAAAQQNVTNAETAVLQQENILKSVMTRTGVDSLTVIDAHIVPTDTIRLPEKEPVRPVQDLVTQALAQRPEIQQSALQLQNARINLQGTRSAMLPSLDVGASLVNHGMAGTVNSLPVCSPAVSGAIGATSCPSVVPPGYLLTPGGLVRTPGAVNGFFLGGFGSVMGQIFSRNFPDYGVGFQLNIPLRNRSARADYIRDELNVRQQQISDKQLQNNIRLSVVNAKITLEQARAAYDTSVRARQLQEQTLNGARRKYELGTASFLDVVISQRDLVTREQAEVSALNSYVRARLSLETVTGELLKDYNVDVREALRGKVGRPPSALPVLDSQGGAR